MNSFKFVLAFAALACFMGMTQAIFTGGATITAGSTALLAGGTLTTGGALALGGLALLKVGAIAAIALASRGRGRGKRSLDNEDSVFAIAAQLEPAQCYRRLICDLATGKMDKSENDVILSLFNDETPIENVKFEFSTAAKVGKLLKDVEACEVRYSCPVSGQEMSDALRN